MLSEEEKHIIDEFVSTGSDRAATAFVRMYQKFVYATSLRFLNSYDDADDITQEVFIRALDNLHKFKAQSSLKTWLYRITVNTCINFKRKRSIFSVFTRSDNDISEMNGNFNNPEQLLVGKESEEKFLKALSSLPEKQRETFALRYFDDLTYEEISDLLGTSVGGLKANYFQAIKKLQAIMK